MRAYVIMSRSGIYGSAIVSDKPVSVSLSLKYAKEEVERLNKTAKYNSYFYESVKLNSK